MYKADGNQGEHMLVSGCECLLTVVI